MQHTTTNGHHTARICRVKDTDNGVYMWCWRATDSYSVIEKEMESELVSDMHVYTFRIWLSLLIFLCRFALNDFMVTIHLVRTLVCTLFIMYQPFYFLTFSVGSYSLSLICSILFSHSLSIFPPVDCCCCCIFFAMPFFNFCQSRTRPIKLEFHFIKE